MNCLSKSIVLFYFIFVSIGLNARENFQLDKATISVVVPSDWQAAKNLFGMPLTIVGPMVSSGRPVVSFTPTGIKELKFDPKKLEENYVQYKNGREEWLQTHSGKSIEYYPYTNFKNSNGLEVHKVGYSYEMGEIKFWEFSYYILCKDHLYNAKILLRHSHGEKLLKVAEDLVGSFECQ